MPNFSWAVQPPDFSLDTSCASSFAQPVFHFIAYLSYQDGFLKFTFGGVPKVY